MNISRRSMLKAAAAAAMVAMRPTAFAQTGFPSKPVKLIVAFAPGGANDFVARQFSPAFAALLGQPVVVENRAGAGGAIGAQVAAHAAPDGYTVLVHGISLTVQPHLVKDAGYDWRTDFAPVTQLTVSPLVLAVHPSVPAKNVPEFLTFARAKGKDLFFGSAGNGSTQHLTGELFNKMAGTTMTHVPYKGNGPATAALLAGDIQVLFDIVPTALNMGQSGKIRVLAVTGNTRSPKLPDVPTLNESTVPGFIVDPWLALYLPKGTPAPIVQQWLSTAKKALASQDVQARLLEQGFQPVSSSPEELTAFMTRESTKWGKLIAEAHIKGE